MKKSNFLIFSVIVLGLVENASLEGSKVNEQLIDSLNPARTKRSTRGLAQGRNAAAVKDDIDDEFQQLTEVMESLDEKISKLKKGAQGALTALSEQLKTQKIEIEKITTAQTQISNSMTLMTLTLTKLDSKMDSEFAKLTKDHIQLDTKIGKTEALGQALLNKTVEPMSKNTGNWYWLMNSFPPIADEVVTDLYEGKTFVLFKTLRLNWTQANAKCKQHGMELVSFDSKTELAYLEALLRSVIEVPSHPSNYGFKRKAFAWVAASDLQSEGTFIWNNGKSFSSTYFGPGEPNNHNLEGVGGEDCVDIGFDAYYNQTLFNANDSPCEIALPVLCQKYAALYADSDKKT